MPNVAPLLALILLIGFVYVVLLLLRLERGKAEPAAPPSVSFRKKDHLLTRTERLFYGALGAAVAPNHIVFAKVRLADLLWLPEDAPNRRSQLNRVISKHVDFVLCTPDSLRPAAAVELDDASDDAPERRERDAFVDAAFAAAQLPLVRFVAQAQYDPNEIAARIKEAIGAPAPPGDGPQ